MRDEKLFGRLKILSDDEVDRIHDGALRTLSSVGIVFEDAAARETLRAAGAKVDGERVRIPEELVDASLAIGPGRVVLGARASDRSIELGRRRFVTTNGFGTTHVLGSEGVGLREATADDLRRLTRLADGLEQVGFCQNQVSPSDLPQDLLDVALAAIVLANTSKHAHISVYSARFADEVIELGRIAGGDRPSEIPHVFSLGCCSVSPLRYPAEATVLLGEAAKRRIPFLLVSGAVAGVMSPVTLAGSLVVQTAEHLAATVLARAIEADAPVAWGSFTSPMDPRTSRQRLGASELALLNGATAQLCERCGIPFGYGTGGVTDSSEVGFQSGIEKGLTTLAAALAGAEVIHDAASGILASGLVVSYEQMVIDAEMCRIVRRFLEGIRVDDETLALPVIEDVGPGGTFLTTQHTATNFRNELLLSDLWVQGDGREPEDLLGSAHDRVESMLAAHRPDPLSDEQIKAMLAIWKRVGLDEGAGRRLVTTEGAA